MAERSFSPESQELFGLLSGDTNPLHFDTAEARRVLIGRPVVHGIHLLLWALGVCLTKPCRISQVSVRFRSPLAVGEPVSCEARAVSETASALDCRAAGRTVMTAEIDADAPGAAVPIADERPESEPCSVLTARSISEAAGTMGLCLDRRLMELLLPDAAERLPADQLAILLGTTRLVGMRCPGLHSIYSALDLSFGPSAMAAAGSLAWRVRRFDARFSRATIDLSAPGVEGTVIALLRPEPVAQPRFSDIARLVAPQTWTGRRALVIGGSRGLGEIGSKMLGAGGAEIRLTYHRDAEAAQGVAEDINAGGGYARAVPFDVLDPPRDLGRLLGGGWLPTHLYYFATPRIFVGGRGDFDRRLLDLFRAYYVTGLVETVRAIRRFTDAPLTVFYPSSVAVETPPPDMREYAAAKQAGEDACYSLAAADDKLTIDVERLPRVLTDQTATVMPVETADPIPLLLSILKRG